MRIRCPFCEKRYSVKEGVPLTTRVVCQQCRESFTVAEAQVLTISRDADTAAGEKLDNLPIVADADGDRATRSPQEELIAQLVSMPDKSSRTSSAFSTAVRIAAHASAKGSTIRRSGSRQGVSVRAKEDAKPYGIVSLLLMGMLIVCFFTPWLDFVLVKISPVSLVMNMGRLMVSETNHRTSNSHSARPMRRTDEIEITEKGAGGLMLIGSPFLYALGLGVGVAGAMITLSKWRSWVGILGFTVCGVACLLALLGWELIFSGTGERALSALGGAAGFGLTPWFYAALCASGLGFIVSFVAMTK